MKENLKVQKQNTLPEFFDNLLQTIREASRPQAPANVCINQSRTFVDITINAVSPSRPGLLRRLLSKLF